VIFCPDLIARLLSIAVCYTMIDYAQIDHAQIDHVRSFWTKKGSKFFILKCHFLSFLQNIAQPFKIAAPASYSCRIPLLRFLINASVYLQKSTLKQTFYFEHYTAKSRKLELRRVENCTAVDSPVPNIMGKPKVLREKVALLPQSKKHKKFGGDEESEVKTTLLLIR
jgi:hypothetical protein